jgi:hypothetical protein
MRCTFFLAALGTVLCLAAPPPARAGLDVGIGTVFGRSGVGAGVGYRFGGWRDRFGVGIHLDASRYVNRRSRDRRGDRKEGEREERNVRLRISPRQAWVYLNGVRTDADGRERLSLPPGKHHLEFVRGGYRTEAVELDVRPGVEYEVERKLSKLGKGEAADPRGDIREAPASVEEALRLTAPAPREPARFQDKAVPKVPEREWPGRVRPRNGAIPAGGAAQAAPPA